MIGLLDEAAHSQGYYKSSSIIGRIDACAIAELLEQEGLLKENYAIKKSMLFGPYKDKVYYRIGLG